MAKDKDKKGSAYETKQTTQYSREGLNLRDLIAQQAGGSDKASFEKYLQSAGLSRKNQRQLTKAYDAIQNDNRDYILDKKGTGFNVFDKTQNNAAQTASGKGKGNTKGFTVSDLVGLGNNVSKLAGFVNSNRDQSTEALKDAVPWKKPAKDEGQVTDPFAPTTAVAGPAGPASSGKGKGGSGKSDRKLTAQEIAAARARTQTMLDGLGPTTTNDTRKSQDLIMNQNAPDDGLPNWGGVALPGKGSSSKGPSEEEQVRRQIFSAAAQGSIMSNWEPFALENKKKALTNQLNNRASASPWANKVDLAKNIDTEQRTEAANTRKSAMAFMELGATVLGGVGTAGLLAKGTRFAWAGAKKGAQMLGKKFAKKATTAPPVKPRIKMPQTSPFPAPGTPPIPAPPMVNSAGVVLKPRVKMPQVSPYAKGGKIDPPGKKSLRDFLPVMQADAVRVSPSTQKLEMEARGEFADRFIKHHTKRNYTPELLHVLNSGAKKDMTIQAAIGSPAQKHMAKNWLESSDNWSGQDFYDAYPADQTMNIRPFRRDATLSFHFNPEHIPTTKHLGRQYKMRGFGFEKGGKIILKNLI